MAGPLSDLRVVDHPKLGSVGMAGISYKLGNTPAEIDRHPRCSASIPTKSSASLGSVPISWSSFAVMARSRAEAKRY